MPITWDSNFEASPADTDEFKYGASKIRELKLAISERLELEMNFKAGTQPLGKAGKLAVIFLGTTTEINNLTGMAAGAFAWDTTLKVLKRYSGTAWAILDIDHGQLSGLADDDHTQYLHLNKAAQTLSQSLVVATGKTVDGRDISVDGDAFDTHKAGTASAQHAAGLGLGTVFGAWETKSNNTVYQAATDGIVIGYTFADNFQTIDGYTDGSNPPTTKRWSSNSGSSGGPSHISMPVKKSDYWKADMTSCPYLGWISIGG